MKLEHKLSIRSLARQLKCTERDCADVEDLVKKFDDDFNTVCTEAMSHMPKKPSETSLQSIISKLTIEESKYSTPDLPVEEKTEKQKKKDIFRKISLAAHPDRHMHVGANSAVESERLKKLFIDANEAYDSGNIDKLINIALDLNVDLSDLGYKYDDIVAILKKLTNASFNRMKSFMDSFAWLWGTSFGNQEVRKNLVVSILGRHGYYDVDELLICNLIESHEEKNGEF